jgi:uncharacterized protein YidB (DUF937 family)
MGLIDTLTGLFKSGGFQDQLAKSVSGMISDGSLSLSKFKERFDQAGLSDIFDSWVGKGENKPISAEQFKQAADPENLQKIAAEAGITVDEAAEELSKAIPDVVNTLTPDGVLPSDDAIRTQFVTGKG